MSHTYMWNDDDNNNSEEIKRTKKKKTKKISVFSVKIHIGMQQI